MNSKNNNSALLALNYASVAKTHKFAIAALAWLVMLIAPPAFSQTQLIGPGTGTNGGGDFENGSTFASNGWNTANGTATNNPTQWFVGSPGSTLFSISTTNKYAYISDNSGSAWTYTTGGATTATYTHFYRQVTIPSSEKIINLSFDWYSNGVTSTAPTSIDFMYDGLQVAVLPGTTAPSASDNTYTSTATEQDGSVLGSTAILITPGKAGMLNGKSSPQSFYTELPASLSGTTFYLVFSWRNNNTAAFNKPAAIDNVLLVSDNPAASHAYDKTLFVEFFGTSIFDVDEDNDGVYEREDALLQYALSHGYQNLILKKLDDKTISSTSSTLLFPRASTITTANNASLESQLANFLHKAHSAPFNIRYIGAGSPPTQGSGALQASTDNLFFDNINEFNHRQLTAPINHNASYCFDIIFTEADYWGYDPNPNTTIYANYNDYFKYGLEHMHDDVKSASNSTGYHPLLVSTYIGELDKLATVTSGTQVPIQAQANMLEENVDWLFLSFYFDGQLLDHSPRSVSPYPIEFFERDINFWGNRLSAFNSTTINGNASHNIKILPLFGGQSSGDAGRNYFGDYLKNKNGHVYDQSTDRNWYGYPDNLDLLFNIYLNTPNPLNATTATTSIKTQFPNINFSEGFGWFKYGAMPDADHLLKIDTDPLTVVQTSNLAINSEEIVTVGGHTCTNCNTINAQSGYSATPTYSWYKYNKNTGLQDLLGGSADNINAPVSTNTTDYYTCVSEFNDPTHTGTFSQLQIRDEIKFTGASTLVGYNPYWVVNSVTEASCPNYTNGSAEVYLSQCGCGILSYHWERSGYAPVVTTTAAVSGLQSGLYTVVPYCSYGPCQATYTDIYNVVHTFYPTTQIAINSTLNIPSPKIKNSFESLNCNAFLSIDDYTGAQYQWKLNGQNISGASAQSYTASQNGVYTVTVTSSANCFGTSAPYILQMFPTPTITGSSITCEMNKTYVVNEDPNNATYTWSVPNGVIKTINGNSMTITNWASFANTGCTISCTVTNACGNSATANFVVKGCCDAGTGDLNNATLSSSQTLNGSFNINGTLNITGSGTVVTMNSADVQLNKEATINVGAGAKLIITGSSYLRTCGTDMWTGIVLQSSTSEVQLIGKSKIEDALIAINSIQNGKVVIDDATLNANYIGLKITGTGVANSSYIGSSAIFSCKNSSNANANCLKSPHSSQRTLQGICLNGIGSISIGDASNSANVICNCETGIYTSTSSVNVIKTDFEACNIGINAQNDADLNVTSSNFAECVTGIDDRYNVDLNVSSCNFSTGTKGIYTSLGNKISIGINNNNFTDIKAFAIQHISNHQVQYSIYSNIISNTESEGMNYPGGIEINGLYDNSIDNSSVTDILPQ